MAAARPPISGARAEARALEPSAQKPARRIAWIALLLLAVLAAWWLRDPRRREDAVDLALSPFGWRAHAAWRTTPNGGVILGWKRLPAARTYVVRFLTPGGQVIDSIDGVETLELVLTREALPRHLAAGSTVRWTVVALRSGKELGHSPPAPLHLP